MKSSKSQQKTGVRKLIKMKTEHIIIIFFFLMHAPTLENLWELGNYTVAQLKPWIYSAHTCWLQHCHVSNHASITPLQK